MKTYLVLLAMLITSQAYAVQLTDLVLGEPTMTIKRETTTEDIAASVEMMQRGCSPGTYQILSTGSPYQEEYYYTADLKRIHTVQLIGFHCQ